MSHPEKPALHKDSLMGELESIKRLLYNDSNLAIPTLDDPLSEADRDTADTGKQPLFNLDSIFELPATKAASAAAGKPDIPTVTLQVTAGAAERQAPLLAADEADEKPPRYTRPAHPPRQQADFSIELLIQEIVDDYIPQIEAELRLRLSQCEPDIIRELAARHLKP